MPQAPIVEGNLTNAELTAVIMNLTLLMTAQAHVFNNHFGAQANEVVEAQPNTSTLLLEFGIS